MNLIKTTPVAASPCPAVYDPREIAARFDALLGDESRLRADSVQAIYFPGTVNELAGAFRELREKGMTCVISGGRTGITGGAVPVGADAAVSLEKMKRILGFDREGEKYYVRLEAGVTLEEMEVGLSRLHLEDTQGTKLWFPVDPTERSAQFGGMAATNASGPRTYRYGSTRHWVKGLSLVLPDGGLIKVQRGDAQADGRFFRMTDARGSSREITLPDIAVPGVKCAAGYYVKPGMDFVDLLVGSEGTLGAFAELEVWLTEKPEAMLGIFAGIADEASALDLVEKARNTRELPLQAIEYFDPDSLRMLQERRTEEGAGSAIPEIPFREGAAVYLEMAGSEDAVQRSMEQLGRLFLSLGLSLDRTWAAEDDEDRRRQKLLRHAVPEAVNAWIGRQKRLHPGLHKVGTDFAVPDGALREMFSLYRKGLREAGLRSVLFGHIGNNHVHVNVLPKDAREAAAAENLYLQWAKAAVRYGGAVSGEHGIGRLKRNLLEIQYPPEALAAMRWIRQAFDPLGTLAPGVLL